MNNRSFTLIVAFVALTGIIMTALFGTTDVQQKVIPSIIIGAMLFIYAYLSADEKERNTGNQHRNESNTAAGSKTAVSEGSLHSVGVRENAAA